MADNRIVESRLMKGLDLAESARWRDYTSAIREGYRRKHRESAPTELISATAQLMENTRQWMSRMDEATAYINLGSFKDYGFDLISAVVPNLIASEVCSMQAMEQRVGAIFYLDYVAGIARNDVASANTVLNSAFGGQAAVSQYSLSDLITEELAYASGTTVTLTKGTPAAGRAPIVYVDGVLDAAATVVGTTVTPSVSSGAGKKVTVKYFIVDLGTTDVNGYDKFTPGAATLNLDLKMVEITAKNRKLRANWLLDSAYDLKQMKGIDAENELVTAMASQIKNEIDQEILNDMYLMAGQTAVTWDASSPANSLSYRDYKETFLDVLTDASNKIFKATKRTGANFIVAGTNVCTIIESMDSFKADMLGSKMINGAHKIGVLADKWTVYKNPFYGDDQYLLGYKGNSWMDAGFVYAPYLPITTTPTVALDDFQFRKGMATAYGTQMVNANLYCSGTIENFANRVFNAVIPTP